MAQTKRLHLAWEPPSSEWQISATERPTGCVIQACISLANDGRANSRKQIVEASGEVILLRDPQL